MVITGLSRASIPARNSPRAGDPVLATKHDDAVVHDQRVPLGAHRLKGVLAERQL
jgi:hypothetical protein